MWINLTKLLLAFLRGEITKKFAAFCVDLIV